MRPKTSRPGNKPSRHPPQDGYSITGRIWIEKDGQLYLGGGRVMLLERLDETGSIAAAARSMGLSYRNAWLWIDSMNRLAPFPLVDKTVGGGRKGHASLTPAGRQAVDLYHELRRCLDGLLNQGTPGIDRASGRPICHYERGEAIP